ncbi:PHP domain-containing protein [Halovenus sp. WSH3]|uniref:PHP domain-containing protein n=1 Tax=Halovenus carboxidivorans TaxID=2692199 RepID=A0A6B0T709_9EURY|nr:PHP domain-containing protein [Halovenus carboxidivorans]MXR51072.1 PHP domain-containing protein [Halovenus carboxidivorans]
MVVADLHVHTTNSDGQLTLETIPDAAAEAGVEVVAVTDHDRLHPELSEPISERDGTTVIHGIELRVEAGQQRLDLLGYAARRTERLEALTERLQENRIERAREIIENVEEETGASLSVELTPGVGRPHIARAIADSDAPYDYREAFADLIGDDQPCYVPREIPAFEEGVSVLREACSVVGLAHPFRYDDPTAALERARELDAVEVPYPYGKAVDRQPAVAVADEEGLLVTGGSDAHELEVGIDGLDAEQYRAVESAL